MNNLDLLHRSTGMPTVDRLASRHRLKKAKVEAEEIFQKWKDSGDHAEEYTKNIFATSELIEVDKILDDKDFHNIRTVVDPLKLAELQTSIDLEGLRTPITVVATLPVGYYYVRAGFRRTQAVRNLGWKEVPAVVLPVDTAPSDEYWTNILENTNREKLSHYEIAAAAKMMRDKFGVNANAFAYKSGHAPSLIYNLLTCMDKLPPEVLHSWGRGDRVPFTVYLQLTSMTPLEAIKNLRLWIGQHRIAVTEKQVSEAFRKLTARRTDKDKLLTVRGIERSQRLIMAIRVSKLPQREKDLCQQVVEYCQGGRRRIDGLVNDRDRVVNHEHEAPVFDELSLHNGKLLPPAPSREIEEHRGQMERTFRELADEASLPED